MSVATRHQLEQAVCSARTSDVRDAEKRRQTFEWVGCVVMSPCATFVHVGGGSSYNLAQVVEAVVFHQSSHSSSTALSNPNVFW